MNESSLIEYRASPIHGTGGYALLDIPAGARVVEYVGRRIDKAESSHQCEIENPYIFCLDDEYDLDGNVEWNPARHLNHSCEPNAEAQEEDGRIWIIALREIRCGEEITFNYNYDLEDYRDHPCQCGMPACVGYMVAEEFFSAVRTA